MMKLFSQQSSENAVSDQIGHAESENYVQLLSDGFRSYIYIYIYIYIEYQDESRNHMILHVIHVILVNSSINSISIYRHISASIMYNIWIS
jgi:hypothetical protein